jgi:hypothetical protein
MGSPSTQRPTRWAAVPLGLCLHFFFCFWPAAGSAYFEKGGVTGIGARPLGMGGAFVAVADETTAVWWNPAGLGQLARAELAGTYAAVFNGKVNYLFSSAAFPVLADSILGVSWERKDFSQSSLKEDVFYASFASTLTEDRTFFGGVNVKFYNASSPFRNVGGNGIGLDWGILYRLPLPKYGKEVRFGFMAQDLATEIREAAGVTQDIPSVIRFGAAYQFERWITLALDGENFKDPSVSKPTSTRLRTGVEGWFFEGALGVRLGFVGFATVPGRYSAGVSYRAQDWEVDYAFLGHAGNLGDSHRASFALRFGRVAASSVRPTAPLGLKVTPKDSEVELVWTPNPEPQVGAYNIYISTAPGGEYRKINTVGLASARIIGLENGRTYYFVVSAISNTQPPLESERSAEVPATPIAPQLAAVELQQQVMEGEITVSWRQGVGDIAGYNLYLSTMSGAGHVRYNSQPLTSTTVRIVQFPGPNGPVPVVAGERYYIYVRSVSRSVPPVEGPPSPEQTFIAVPRQ